MLACAALFALTLLVFSRALTCGFVDLDDPDFLTMNPAVQRGLDARAVREAFSTSDAGNWYPLTRLSHVAAWQAFGADPAAHHAVNVLLHAANAVLAFLLLLKLTRHFWTSAASAALFAWHPLRVESVVWIAERKDVLSAFFGLAAVWAYASHVEARRDGRRSAWASYAGVWLAFAAGLLSKPMLVTLPFVLLLLDVWPLARAPWPGSRPAGAPPAGATWRRLAVEKLPFLALSLASCAVTYLVQRKDGALPDGLPLSLRLGNAAVSLARYLGKFFAPADLSVAYAYPESHLAIGAAAAAALLAGLTAFAWRRRRRRPWLLVGWLWFVGMLVPVSGILQSGLQAMADRYTYLPVLGLQLALLWTLREKLAARPRTAAGLAAAAGLACVALTWRQIGFWRDSSTLFTHALAVEEANPLAHTYLATTLLHAGRIDQAITHDRRALSLSPGYAAAHLGLAAALDRTEAADEALAQYRAAVRLKPDFPAAQHGLGLALLKRGRAAEAARHFRAAVACRPDFIPAWRGLGLAAEQTGRTAEALRCFEAARRLDPRSTQARRDCARVLAGERRFAEAAQELRGAIAMDPTDAEACYELASVLQSAGRSGAAEAMYRGAIHRRPAFAEAHYDLGVLLLGEGRTDEAAAHFRAAAASHPDFGPAYFGLGVIAAQVGRLDEAIVDYRRTLDRLPNHAEAHNALGHALAAKGLWRDALAEWETAERLDPTIDGLADALADARARIQAADASH